MDRWIESGWPRLETRIGTAGSINKYWQGSLASLTPKGYRPLLAVDLEMDGRETMGGRERRSATGYSAVAVVLHYRRWEARRSSRNRAYRPENGTEVARGYVARSFEFYGGLGDGCNGTQATGASRRWLGSTGKHRRRGTDD